MSDLTGEAAAGAEASTPAPQPDPEAEARMADVAAFMAQQGMTANRKKQRSMAALSPQGWEVYKLGIVIATSCRSMDLDRAYAAYLGAKSQGVRPSNETFSNLLNLVAGLGDQGSSLAPPREVEPPQNLAAALVVFADMRAAGIPLNECCYTAMIRCCSMNAHEDQALELYREMTSQSLTPKLRTFHPLLAAFARLGNDTVCFSLFADLSAHALVPTEREYLSMLRLLSLLRDDRFYPTLEAMMEDVLVPTPDAWPVLRDWFAQHGYSVQEAEASKAGLLALAPPSPALCLRSIDMDAPTQQALLGQIDAIVAARSSPPAASADQNGSSSGSGGGGGGNGDGNAGPGLVAAAGAAERASRKHREVLDKWEAFKAWLRASAGYMPPDEATGSSSGSSSSSRAFDVVVDGANCGYYKQNYAGAPSHVDYRQIDWMVRQLQERGFRPLLVLHSRHLQPSMPAEFRDIVAAWRRESLLFETPSGSNDDWFWLYTAVALEAKVVTNDEMRDHHFQMLHPRYFKRWKERRQIHFTFGAWGGGGAAEEAAAGGEGAGSAGSAGSAGGSANAPGPGPGPGLGPEGEQPRCQHSRRAAVLSIPPAYSHRMQCLAPREAYAFPAEGTQSWLCVHRPTTPVDSASVSAEVGAKRAGAGAEGEGREGGEVDESEAQGGNKRRK